MCGICGVLNTGGGPVSMKELQPMVGALAHRGPDGKGVWIEDSVGLGHTRLAILDLTDAGRQPMATEDGRYVIVYNGEIYNFRELRAELEKAGWSFSSRADSEVALKALAQWGTEAVERFNGMFALALWDKVENRLLLARDRYGMKPLYYTRHGDTFIFGSEIKSLLAHPKGVREIDLEGLVEYFTFQNFFSDRTLFDGTRMVPPGSFMEIRGGGAVRREQYWDFGFHEPAQVKDEREYIEELASLLERAVERQLVSDVEIGAYLSGGIDSGAITAIAAQRLPYMKSFTIGFDLSSASGLELGFDEREAAERMSYLYKTEHYEMVLKAGDMERIIPALTRSLEEPRVGQSYPNYYLARLAGKFVKVALAGVGGDELFGGYPWRYYRAVVNDDFDHYIDKYYSYWQRMVPDEISEVFFAPIMKRFKAVSPKDIFRDVFHGRACSPARPEDYVNHSLYFEAKTFLHGLLVVEDKLSMAHGLETRAPFLDNDLVDFAMKVPVRLKLGKLNDVTRLNENEPGPKTAKYFEKTRDGKLILRKTISGYVPNEVSGGVKKGFSAPDAGWFRGESIDYVRGALFSGRARLYEYLDRRAVQGMVSEHLEGRVNRRLLIWSLLNFEEWLKQFM